MTYQQSPVPVTVLSGFLGAGKTTLLKNILTQNHGKKIAIIVNDMSEVNIDAELVKNNNISIEHTEEKLIEMSNGCICCTLREDLLDEISNLAKEGRYDAILIESSGISEPLPVAETFTFADEAGYPLMKYARLDTLVTVVDAFNFFDTFQSTQTVQDINAGISDQDKRTLVHLMTDQIEFADIILISKVDLVDDMQLQKIRALIRKLNAGALIYEMSHGKIDYDLIINTHLFNFEKASSHAGWLKEIRGEHVPETEEYGISSFVYSADKMFKHDDVLMVLQSNICKGIIRSKGFIATDAMPDSALLLSHAGTLMNIEPYGYWENGNINQKIVFIGVHMDKEKIKSALDTALHDE